MTATGGLISDYESGGDYYRGHTFTGHLEPLKSLHCLLMHHLMLDYLVVAGGGGGGVGGDETITQYQAGGGGGKCWWIKFQTQL